jgi:hypothetical protein
MNGFRFLLFALSAIGLAAVFLSAKSEFVVSRNPDGSLSLPLPFTTKPTPSPQKQLSSPPRTVKAIYLTSWSAGIPSRLNEAINLIDSTELNGIVIDVKDFSGKVAFETTSPLIKAIGSEERRMADFPGLVSQLHQHGIYVIVRIAVFQDQHLLKARPELAIKDKRNGAVWRDRKGLGWVDPSAREVWDYNLEVAKEAIKAGVDEVNFDYIRFPSDGSLENLDYPFWKENEDSRRKIIKNFSAYLQQNLKNSQAKTSADIFGLATVNKDDLGIGQVLEDFLPYFDFISPMVYPSHYASGFLQYKNPAAHPYEVIEYSLKTAMNRRAQFAARYSTSTRETISPELREHLKPPEKIALFRPWLQAFDLGADYTPEMIRKEIQAVYDVGIEEGWILWDPGNHYPQEIFARE